MILDLLWINLVVNYIVKTNNLVKLQRDLLNEFNKCNIDVNKKFLIGVSGGPDSMWLLNLLKSLNIVAAHVNYNKRYDSNYDESLVSRFCANNNIPLEILSLHNKYSSGNFQAIARKERYDFYFEISKKYQCDYILLAHQKDDFLESSIMQENSNRKPLFWGIKQLNILNNNIIFRPMLNLWTKQEIIDFCNEYSILFATDYTNAETHYTRNKIRSNLKKLDPEQKQNKYQFFVNKNIENEHIEKQVLESFEDWKNNQFNVDKLDKNFVYIDQLLFYTLNHFYNNLKLSLNKIHGIKDFLFSQNRTKNFKLNDEQYIHKIKNLLIFK